MVSTRVCGTLSQGSNPCRHPYFMDLVIQKTNSGRGVFAGRDFKAGEKILDFSGPILSREELPSEILNPEDDRFLQIDRDLFLGPSGKIDDLVNHSCDPNTAILIKNDQVSLWAIKNIKIGEEISYDYSLQMFNEDWTMKCQCGTKNCRQIVREYRFLSQEIKDYYLKLGFVPLYNRDL